MKPRLVEVTPESREEIDQDLIKAVKAMKGKPRVYKMRVDMPSKSMTLMTTSKDLWLQIGEWSFDALECACRLISAEFDAGNQPIIVRIRAFPDEKDIGEGILITNAGNNTYHLSYTRI